MFISDYVYDYTYIYIRGIYMGKGMYVHSITCTDILKCTFGTLIF